MSKKKKGIVVDLDGTILDSSYPVSYLTGEREKSNYQTYYRLLDMCKPIQEVIELVKAYIWEEDCDVIFLTGRNWEKHVAYATAESIEKIFETELDAKKCNFDIRFRELNNHEASHQYKKKKLESIQAEYDIMALFDDEPAILEMYMMNPALDGCAIYGIKHPNFTWDYSNFKHKMIPLYEDSESVYTCEKNILVKEEQEHNVLF